MYSALAHLIIIHNDKCFVSFSRLLSRLYFLLSWHVLFIIGFFFFSFLIRVDKASQLNENIARWTDAKKHFSNSIFHSPSHFL